MAATLSLLVHTARISYGGDDRLDITMAGLRRARQRGEPFEGQAFAPSRKLVYWGKNMLEQANKRRAVGEQHVDEFEDWVWQQYVDRYTWQMRQSYRHNRQDWERLLQRDRVVLVCFCTDAQRCHRRVLAGILERCGAIDRGEIET